MAELDLNVSWDQIEDQPDFQLIPPGDYVCEIEASEEKPTKDGTGSYFNLKIKITEGQYENRLIFQMLHLGNKSEKCRNFALSTLKKICTAVGMDGKLPKDTSELHGVPFLAYVGIRKGVGSYEDQNEVKTWNPLQDMVPNSPKKETSKTVTALPSRSKAPATPMSDDDIPF